MSARVRITVRSDRPRNELRGYIEIEDMSELEAFARAMKPFGLVMASPADHDYDPFQEWDPAKWIREDRDER